VANDGEGRPVADGEPGPTGAPAQRRRAVASPVNGPEATSAERPATGADGPATGADLPAAGVGLVPTGRFGDPGRPLRRNAFLVGFTGGLGVLLAYAAFLAVRNAASILVLVFIALFLAIGLNPAVDRLRSWGLPRGLAVATVALTVVLLLCGGLFALVPPLVTQAGQFIDHLPSYVNELRRNETINHLIVRYNVIHRLQAALNPQTVGGALGGVFDGTRLIFGTIFNVLTVLVLTIYFMSTFDRLKALAYGLVPASRRDRVRLIGDEILTKVGAYMFGALAIAVLAGVSTFVFAMILNLAYPFALAVVVAICDLIPQIGATLGAIVLSVVGFATSLPAGIACVVFFIVYQQVENYLIYPKVMRRSVEVNDAAAIVGALLGVALFGVVGALVAIPAIAALQLILREVVLPRQQSR
jgi:predicted PurR-regulated permease PerM